MLREYKRTDHIEPRAELGRRLARGINTHAERTGHALRVVGYDAFPSFQLAHAERFVDAMARRGVLLRARVSFLSSAHTDAQIDQTIERVRMQLDVTD